MSGSYNITLNTRDGSAVSFDCGEQESLLDASARSGYSLPSMCKSGSCGACRGHYSDGEVALGDYNPQALSDEARAQGETLLCCSYPRSDLSVRVDQTLAAISAPATVERDGTVTGLEAMGGEVIRLMLKLGPTPDGDVSAGFEAGQYVELTLPDGAVTRAYSIANTPNWEGLMEFYIRLQPGGKFSAWLQQAKLGETLRVKGPSGSFTLDESSLAPRWFVAGGTGLAPVMSMLRWMVEMGAMQPARLYFGLNREADRFAEPELEALKGMLMGLQVELCLWQPEGEWSGFTGTPVDALRRDLAVALAGGMQPDLYLCGPPALIDGCERLAAELGLDASHVHSERFLPS